MASMDVRNRDKSEAELNEVLLLVWQEWSKVRDPSTLTQESLESLLEKNCKDKVWAVWVRANLDLLKEFGQERDDDALAAAFLLFFMNWKRDLSERWTTRVTDWQVLRVQQEKERERAIERRDKEIERQKETGESGKKPDGKKPIELEEIPPEPPKWRAARELIVQDHDIERESVTSVTAIHTDGETNAAKVVEKESDDDSYLLPFWMTEPGACKEVCAPLHNKPPNVWRKVSLGPPAHPHCVLGDTVVSLPGLMACAKATYTGSVYRIKTSDGSKFAVTQGHMFLAPSGFVRAVDLRPKAKLIRVKDWMCLDQAANVFEVNKSISKHRTVVDNPDASHLHGDGDKVSGGIEVVNLLEEFRQDFGGQEIGIVLGALKDEARFSFDLDRELESSGPQSVSVRSRYVDAFETIQERFQSSVSVVQVVSVVVDQVTYCPVYDFQTESTVYTVGKGVVSSNCRCWLDWRRMVD